MSASRSVPSRRRRSFALIRLSATTGAPYRASHRSKCVAVASVRKRSVRAEQDGASSTIVGRAATTEASCDQNTGMDPRICTALETAIEEAKDALRVSLQKMPSDATRRIARRRGVHDLLRLHLVRDPAARVDAAVGIRARGAATAAR